MLPLSIDLKRLRLALIGNDAPALRRLQWLDAADARALTVFSEAPSAALREVGGARLVMRFPTAKELAETQLVFIADIAEPHRGVLAAMARTGGAILHVEDAPALTDVHAPAVLRRGDLAIAVSTNGAAPGLAAALKDFLAEIFGPEWRGRVAELRSMRRQWRSAQASATEIRRFTAARIAERGWLPASLVAVANDRNGSLTEEGKGGLS